MEWLTQKVHFCTDYRKYLFNKFLNPLSYFEVQRPGSGFSAKSNRIHIPGFFYPSYIPGSARLKMQIRTLQN